MSAKILRAFVATSALAAISASWGCVADRPSRNGVFNENQYVRKDFLIRPGDSSKPDNGWFLKATIPSTSTPNPLAGAGLQAGLANEGTLIRFDVTQDKLRMLNVREIGPVDPNQGSRQPEAVNAWPISTGCGVTASLVTIVVLTCCCTLHATPVFELPFTCAVNVTR